MKDARYSRTDPRAGFTSGKRLDGCRECAGELPSGRRSFCGDACVHAWKLRSSPSYAAQRVLERDHGCCAECGLDCVALDRDLRALLREARLERGHYDGWEALSFELRTDHPFGARIQELGLTGERARLRRRLWEMDHVVPVVEGGGSCGLANLRTLCWRCHRAATAALARRRAERRKAERQKDASQMALTTESEAPPAAAEGSEGT